MSAASVASALSALSAPSAYHCCPCVLLLVSPSTLRPTAAACLYGGAVAPGLASAELAAPSAEPRCGAPGVAAD